MNKKFLSFFSIILLCSCTFSNASLEETNPKKTYFSHIPITKIDAEKVISPLLKKDSEVLSAITDFLNLTFDQENNTSFISLKLEIWNVMIDRLFEKDAVEQVTAINISYLAYTRLTRSKLSTRQP